MGNHGSHEPDIDPTGEGLLDAREKEAANTQSALMKHGEWSVGSQAHLDGICGKPCLSLHALKGCKSAFNGTCCHLPQVQCSIHSGSRPWKEKCEKSEKCKQRLDSCLGLNGDHFDRTSSQLKHVELGLDVQGAQHPTYAPV